MNKKYLIVPLIIILLSAYALSSFYRRQNRPNVLFITLDALRADHLNCYGYKRNTSPNIANLAARGVLFKQAIAQASWTTASVNSIVSSLYPNHEIREAGYHLVPKNDNLIGPLKKKGYATALFSNAKPILSITFSRIKDSFDVFNISPLPADKVVDSASQWLDNNKGMHRPFFLWVYLFDTHHPYNAPNCYFSEFLSDGMYPHENVPFTPKDGFKNEYYSFGTLPRLIAENEIADTSYYIAKYDGGIKFSDEQVARLLKTLKDKGFEDNTLIVLFSDHGESLTEHRFYFNHSHFLYDGLIRVPLIMVLPGRLPQTVIENQVQLINIVPTVMEILGIRNRPHTEGWSMLPLIKKGGGRGDTYAFSETAYRPSPACVRSSEWKLIHNRNTPDSSRRLELYNLKEDPAEQHNLADSKPDVVDSLLGQLNAWQLRSKTYSLDLERKISSEDEQKLRSLGYIN